LTSRCGYGYNLLLLLPLVERIFLNRILEFLWIIVRLTVFWLAVYGFGDIVRHYIKKLGYESISEFAGIVALLVLSIPLSLLGVFSRPVLTALLLTGAIIKIVMIFRNKQDYSRLSFLEYRV